MRWFILGDDNACSWQWWLIEVGWVVWRVLLHCTCAGVRLVWLARVANSTAVVVGALPGGCWHLICYPQASTLCPGMVKIKCRPMQLFNNHGYMSKSPKSKSPKLKSPRLKSPKSKSPKLKSPRSNSPKIRIKETHRKTTRQLNWNGKLFA